MPRPSAKPFLLTVLAAGAGACGAPAAPVGASWSSSRASSLCASDEQKLDAEQTPSPIAYGYQGALYTTRPRYGSQEAFQVFFDYRGPDGNPVAGLSFDAEILPQNGAQTAPQMIALGPYPDLPPGTTEGLVLAAPDWSSITVLVNAPYVTPQLWDGGRVPQVIVDHTSPAQLASHYVHSTSSGVALDALIDVDAPAEVAIQLDVAATDGTFLGEWTEQVRRTPGQPLLETPLPSGAIADAARNGQLVLARAALEIDGVCTDLVRDKMPLAVE
jgi:hypothetical protein